MPTTQSHVSFGRRIARHLECLLLTASALALCPTVHAQHSNPPKPAPHAECAKTADPAACEAARERSEEEQRTSRTGEQGQPRVMGDAPLPPQGTEPPPPRITRGPLRVRRAELSVGVDHALSRRWVLGGLIGVSRTRMNRFQSELAPGATPDTAEESDITVRSRDMSVAATLTYYPRDDVFVDITASVLRSSFENERMVNGLVLFTGKNHGRAASLSLNAGRVWRYRQGLQFISEAGLTYANSRIDPLQTTFTFVEEGEGPFPGFTVSAQKLQVLSAQAGGQLQWVRSASFGTWAPYLRLTLQERLHARGDDVVATAPGATAVITDAQLLSTRRSATLGAGLLWQFPGGVSLFAEVDAARGHGGLREIRAASGIKFET